MQKENNFPEDVKPTSFRLPETLKREMKQAALDFNTEQATMVAEGVRMWLESKRDPERSRFVIVAENRRESRWHRILTLILESGDSEIIQAIQQNLKAFSRILQLAGERPNQKRRGGER